MKNNETIDFLLAALKEERGIINQYQMLETISIFLVIRYFEVALKKKFTSVNVNYKDISSHNHYYSQDYVHDCEFFLNKAMQFFNTNFIDNCDLSKILFAHLKNSFLKIRPETIFHCFQILDILCHKDDFFDLFEDYRLLVNSMYFGSLQSDQFYTPKVMCELLVRLLEPKDGDDIYDPACGSSGLLLEAEKYIRSNTSCTHSNLIGADDSSLSGLISFVSFILNGNENLHFELTDSLDSDRHDNRYDIILSNPPFGLLDETVFINPFGNRASYKEYLFLKHIMNSLNNGGRAAVILPERFLIDKKNSCLEIKYELFSKFNVECVLSIPPGSMLPATAVKVIVLLFSKTIPSKDIWIYQMDTVEKFTRMNRIKIKMFDDFFCKFPYKTVSNNSWLVKIDKLGPDYNVLHRDTDFDNKLFRYLDKPQHYLSEYHHNHSKLANSIIKIKKNIEVMNKQINERFNQYQSTSFKLGMLVHSLFVKPLPKGKLLNNGNYPVYGGNGIIGYYNEYTHKGNFIIIGRVGAYCGNVRYVEGEIWVTNNAIILECINLNNVYPPYLSKMLTRKELRRLASGTAQAHLTITRLFDVDISLPPLDIQIELDQWLSELDEELALQQNLIKSMIKEKKAISDSVYQNLLGL